MKAAVYYENGPPEVLKYETVADPDCWDDGLVFRTEAISLEGGDSIHRLTDAPLVVPYIGGFQSAGEVVQVGRDVSNIKVGQKVVAVAPNGSHAELRAVSSARTWIIPEGLDVRTASVVPVAFGTADVCLFSAGSLTEGETVLIQAGAGGLGIAAIQLAARAGATVIATASNPERIERLKDFGATHAVNHREPDVVAEVMQRTGGRGADLVVDAVGGHSLQVSIAAAAQFGRVVTVGNAGREPMTVDAWPLLQNNISLWGVHSGKALGTTEGYHRVSALLQMVAKGELRAEIDRIFPLAEAAAAHAYVESRRAIGRVLMVP